MDLDHHRHRHRCQPQLAVLPSQIRPGTHLPATQTNPRLDPPKDPHTAGRRPVDLADPHLPHPTTPRPAPHRRSTSPLGTTHTPRTPHPGTGPSRVSSHPPEDHPPRRCTKTRQSRPRTATRLKEPTTRTPLPRRENRQTRRDHHRTPKAERLNDKLSLSRRLVRSGRPPVSPLRLWGRRPSANRPTRRRVVRWDARPTAVVQAPGDPSRWSSACATTKRPLPGRLASNIAWSAGRR